jgi:hypothetical protein
VQNKNKFFKKNEKKIVKKQKTAWPVLEPHLVGELPKAIIGLYLHTHSD